MEQRSFRHEEEAEPISLQVKSAPPYDRLKHKLSELYEAEALDSENDELEIESAKSSSKLSTRSHPEDPYSTPEIKKKHITDDFNLTTCYTNPTHSSQPKPLFGHSLLVSKVKRRLTEDFQDSNAFRSLKYSEVL